jgi:hypothetical protein
MGGVRFFSGCGGTIPVLFELLVRGRRWPKQNLEGEGVAAKILRSKDLIDDPIHALSGLPLLTSSDGEVVEGKVRCHREEA